MKEIKNLSDVLLEKLLYRKLIYLNKYIIAINYYQ